jgi:glutaredoxin
VSFIVKDIANDEAARKELVEKYWRLATPTIVIDGKVLVGFRDNRAKLEELLSEK